MKKITIALIVCAAVVGGFVAGRYYRVSAAPVLGGTVVNDHDQYLGEVLGPLGKALLLLVDGTEVYCANDEAPREAVEEYVFKTMELNHVKQVTILGSESARYGDVVALIEKLRKRGLKVVTVSTRAIPTGIRLPLIDTGSYYPTEK